MSIISIINISAIPGQRENLLTAMELGIKLTRENQSCSKIQVLFDSQNRDQITLLEYWDSLDNRREHQKLLGEQGVFSAIMPLIQGALDSNDYQIQSV